MVYYKNIDFILNFLFNLFYISIIVLCFEN
jgi:hypothetical protein